MGVVSEKIVHLSHTV